MTIGSITVSQCNSKGPEWCYTKSAGGTNTDYANSVIVDANGNTYVVGYFSSSSITFGTTTLTNSGSADMFIVKYDASGNMLWAKSAGGTSNDYAQSIAVDANGNTYVAGYFNSSSITFGSNTLTNAAGDYDMFVVKYDASGNVLWAKSAGGTSDDQANSITVDANGNIYVAGSFKSASITFGATTLTNE